MWQEVPGEHRNNLKRLIVTQADTEPASVEQQRWLAETAPSLYDARNLFQVNVEEGRHLWAMVYLLQAYFGKDGRAEAEELLERRSGDEDKPSNLDAFNQPCSDWLTFFCFTTFTDRDGKYQLGALAESAFDPLSRTCRFMLIEEAHHLSVGQKGIERVIRRAVELARQDPNGDARAQGGIDLATIQNMSTIGIPTLWTCSVRKYLPMLLISLLVESKVVGKEAKDYEDHLALHEQKCILQVENGRLVETAVPMRNAMNELLREEYMKDCARVVKAWNRTLEKMDCPTRITLPNNRFHRRQGIYSDHHFDPQGNLIDMETFLKNHDHWLPTDEDRAYVVSLMHGVHDFGQCANWIAAPSRGINGMPFEYEYVRV